MTRAHHADVGGVEPGSLPAGSRELAEEGVVIPPTLLDDDALESLVARMRNPDERRGDLRAQLAAHRLAERRVAELCARHGRERVAAAMDELLAYSERSVRAAIAALPDGRARRGRRARDGRGRARAPRRGHDRRRRDRDRLRRHGAPALRQPQLPARGDPLGLLLRRPLPHRPGPAGLRRRLRPGDRVRPGGVARERAPARRRRRRATSRPRAGSPTCSSSRSDSSSTRPRRGRGR